MAAFIFTFVATILVSIGARDQMRVVHLTLGMGRHIGLLTVALITATLTAAAAGFATRELIPVAPYLPTRDMLAALALGVAGLESIFVAPRPAPKEPTRSLGAAGIVLLADQITDSARMLVLAIALALASPVTAAAGGALGNGAAIAMGWLWAARLAAASGPLRAARIVAGALLLLVAATVASGVAAPMH